MAMAGRRSEFQSQGFDSKFIQFKPNGAGVTLRFSSEFMQNQNPTLIATPGISQQPLLASQNLALLTAQLELLDTTIGIRQSTLFIPIQYNNAGKKLGAATISSWICTTILDTLLCIRSRVSPNQSKLTKSMQWLPHLVLTW